MHDDFWSSDVSSTDDGVTFLTQEAYDRLSRELDELVANRPAMAKEINDRREEGDLKENGGYHAAREEQGKQEGRILQLQQLLRTAKVGEAPVSDGVAGPGMVVEVRFGGDDEVETFLIGSREEAETAAVEVYSAASPLGKALTGRARGRDRRVRDAERQDDEGHPRQREAVRRLSLPTPELHASAPPRPPRSSPGRPSSWSRRAPRRSTARAPAPGRPRRVGRSGRRAGSSGTARRRPAPAPSARPPRRPRPRTRCGK